MYSKVPLSWSKGPRATEPNLPLPGFGPWSVELLRPLRAVHVQQGPLFESALSAVTSLVDRGGLCAVGSLVAPAGLTAALSPVTSPVASAAWVRRRPCLLCPPWWPRRPCVLWAPWWPRPPGYACPYQGLAPEKRKIQTQTAARKRLWKQKRLRTKQLKPKQSH